MHQGELDIKQTQRTRTADRDSGQGLKVWKLRHDSRDTKRSAELNLTYSKNSEDDVATLLPVELLPQANSLAVRLPSPFQQ